MNRGGGFGLEVPCEYIFEGDSFSCGWLQQKLVKEEFDVRCSDLHKPISPNNSTNTLITWYYVVFDELLKETGHASLIFVSKYRM